MIDGLTVGELWEETQPMRIEEFSRPAEVMAEELLSCVIVRGETAGMIVETEAYLGVDDLAAHAARGRTKRTEVLFGPAGRAYVYFIYGMHECLNIVVDVEGQPGCVLIRALQPLCGMDVMRARRNWSGPDKGLANGPGKLTQALAITREHYGARLDEGELVVRRWRSRPKFSAGRTPRIGITQCMDWPLRFVWAGHPCLSKAGLHQVAR
jgi:DNA-3-methyladenine glycosylase